SRFAPGTLIVGANRDERPERPCEGPGVLSEAPHVVGGRDRGAGGTWLAVRERRAIVALLNRRDESSSVNGFSNGLVAGSPNGSSAGPTERRSRGLLALDVACAPEGFENALDASAEHRGLLAKIRATTRDPLGVSALARAFAALWESRYAPCSLVWASPESAWVLSLDGGRAPRVAPISDGWHVITHRDLDDESEPRTAHLLEQLEYFRPRSVEKAEQRLGDLLRTHGDAARDSGRAALPPVCVHEGGMVTVSSSLVFVDGDNGRYFHADGRPCERRFEDRSSLLRGVAHTG
ncbi:MAG: hypothetical protein HOP12_05495, partial [Candidatus Eisenbacteria bacterium]|nr:hypothetical protein [Candidatus Eisenbacteria bacterium]